jgi:hypothetical protein
MPIDRKKYHPKWNLISRLVRFRRAGNHCEECGLRNYSVGYWLDRVWQMPEYTKPPAGGFDTWKEAKAWVDAYNEEIGELYAPAPFTNKVCVVILTVSHLDHNVKNNRFGNLKALCQCCHLGHDRVDNAQKRKYGPTGRHYNQIRLEL